MSRQEIITWGAFVVIAGLTAWYGWLLWDTWPDTGQFAPRNDRGLPFWVAMGVILGAQHLARKWRPREPEADERERGIIDQGYLQGLAALALMQLVLGAVVFARGGVPEGLGREWVQYFLALPVGASFAIVYAYRIVRFRFG